MCVVSVCITQYLCIHFFSTNTFSTDPPISADTFQDPPMSVNTFQDPPMSVNTLQDPPMSATASSETSMDYTYFYPYILSPPDCNFQDQFFTNIPLKLQLGHINLYGTCHHPCAIKQLEKEEVFFVCFTHCHANH